MDTAGSAVRAMFLDNAFLIIDKDFAMYVNNIGQDIRLYRERKVADRL